MEKDGQWSLATIDQPASGRNFQECLASVRNACDLFLEDWVKEERTGQVLSGEKTFEMQKGDHAAIPASMNSLRVGLGWDCRRNFDLDASIVFLGAASNIEDTVFYSDKNSKDGSVRHFGDNTTGAGSGDDETISIDLSKVRDSVMALYVVVNIYSNGSFRDVSNAYVRLLGQRGNVLARYNLISSIRSRALVFCRIFRRHHRSTWQLEAIGQGCEGQKAT